MSRADRTKPIVAISFGCVVSISTLSACSGSGGGTSGTAGSTSTTITTTTNAQPDAIVSAPQGASLHGSSLPLAAGTTPNLTTSLPANGATFPLDEAVVKIASANGQTSAKGYTDSLSGGTTLTLQGTTVIDGTVTNIFELRVPGLSVDAPNLISGNTAPLSNSGNVTLVTSALSYSLLGIWGVAIKGTGSPQPDPVYWSTGFTGYQTPLSGIPTSGTATYATGAANQLPISGSFPPGGGVAGIAFVPNGSAVTLAELGGQAAVDVNFATAKVNGSLFNMTAIASGAALNPVAGPGLKPVPWNDVALSGNLSGATMQGRTSVSSVPSGALSLSGSATGTFIGSLFGPSAQELGLSWTLYDPSGNGKSAIGVVSATTP